MNMDWKAILVAALCIDKEQKALLTTWPHFELGYDTSM